MLAFKRGLRLVFTRTAFGDASGADAESVPRYSFAFPLITKHRDMAEPFNTYTQNLDLQYVHELCKREGETVNYQRGQLLECEGEPARWIGFVEQGCFKYCKRDFNGNDKHIIGFVFEGEFVCDYPNCLTAEPSTVSIEAVMPCRVSLFPGEQLEALYRSSHEAERMGRFIMQHLFLQTYSRMSSLYCADGRQRYEMLLQRCPQIVQQLPLKDIASFLNITPTYLSKIRREITFSTTQVCK